MLRHFIALLFFMTAMLWSITGQRLIAAEMTIVMSSEAEPYQESARHLQKLCPKSNVVSVTDAVINADLAHKHIAIGTQAAAALHEKLDGDRPLFYCMVHEPDKIGLSERHAIGVRTDVPMRAYLKTIKRVMPQAQRIGLLYWGRDDETPPHLNQLLKDVRVYANTEIKSVPVLRQRDVARAVKKLLLLDIDVILIVPDKQLLSSSMLRTVLRKSIDAGVPVCAYSSGCVKAGASFGVHITPKQQAQQLDELIQWIEKHGKAPHWAEESGRHIYVFPNFQIAINQSVVKRIQLEIPKEVEKEVLVLGAVP